MTFPPHSRLGAAAVMALAAALLLAACTNPPESAPDETQVAPTPSASEPETSPTPEPEPAASEDPTCETLIDESVLTDFESLGMTSRVEPFYIGSTEMSEGLQCVWADFEGPAGDHGMIFGWAPISDDDAADAQAQLAQQGWVREDETDGIYVTESPDTTISTDDEGYGMTYLFADGWVKLAGTKQDLLLIEWPKG